MNKVAKLIEVSLMVRVIVDENATEEQIIAASYDKFQDKLDNRELGDNLVSIENDTECPFGTFDTDNQEDDGITNKMLNNAQHYLSAETDEELREMVKKIMNHEEGSDMIDYLDGVVVWEKVELSFTCDAFIDQIS
jgi:hypothetical protein